MMLTADHDVSKRARVLVAEDDDAFRDLLSAALRADGHEVIAVRNGIDLMDVLVMVSRSDSAASFDLVISDVRMPGATGIGAINQLKNVIRLPPVLLLTSFASPELHKRAESAGVVAVIDKPVDLDELRAVVKGILATPPRFGDYGS